MKCRLLVLSLLLACVVRAAGITAGKLTLTLNDKDATISSLTIGGVNVPVAPGRALIEVREVRQGSVFHPLNGPVHRDGDAWVLDGNAPGAAVSGRIRFHGAGGMLAIDCDLANAKAEGRGFIVKVAIPIAEASLRWSGALNEEVTPKPGTFYGMNLFPIAALCDSGSHWGLAAAIPPTDPVSYDTHFRDGEFGLYLYAGISPLTKAHPNHTQLTARFYTIDPKWGFRAALDRYYRAWPELYTVRSETAGAWCFHMNPEDNDLAQKTCTYYEAGGGELSLVPGTEAIRGPSYEVSGYWTSKVSDAKEWAAKNSVQAATSHGMQVFPYTIVGQRQIYMLPQKELIKDYAQQLEAFEKWTIEPVIHFQNPVLANGFHSVRELKEIIRNSSLETADGRMVIEPRIYTGNTLEVYLGDTGIFYRQVNIPQPEAVTANGETEPAVPPPGVQLYTF